jgi:hypothetical protein
MRKPIRDCALFVPIISAHTQARPEGYFRLEWKLAVDRTHLMAAEKAFLMPVVVDATTESDALVPTQFRDVQWTSIRAGEARAAFVDHIAAVPNQPLASHVGSSKQGVGSAPARRLPITLFALSVAALGALVITSAMRGGWLSPHLPSTLILRTHADLALANVEKKYAETGACDIARIHAYRGEIEVAFSWLGRVRQPHCVLSKVDPFFKILRPAPRFKAFLRNMALPE